MIDVHVRGLDGFNADLVVARNRLGDSVRDLCRDLARDSGKAARDKAARGQLTGRSMDSIRAHGPVLTAGADVVWYGFADFGGKVGRDRQIERTYIKDGRWLFPGVKEIGVLRRAEAMMDDVTQEVRR